MRVYYGENDLTDHITAFPELTTGFDFLNDFGLALNDVKIDLPLSRFRDIIKIGGRVRVDDVFVGKIYDMTIDERENMLSAIARHFVYEMTIAEGLIYSATNKNFVDMIKEIMLQFIDGKYIDIENFDKIKSITKDFKGSVSLTYDDAVSPLGVISTLNQLLGLGMYIENNKIKLYYIPNEITGGVAISDNFVIEKPIYTFHFDYYKDAIVIEYNDGVSDLTKAIGTGKAVLNLSTPPNMTITDTVADLILERNYPLYKKIYQNIDIVLTDNNPISISQKISIAGKSFIVKNLTSSENKFSIVGIGISDMGG